MENIAGLIKEHVQALLENKEIKCFIGFEKGPLPFFSVPAFIDEAAEVKRLVWDDFCGANLSVYLQHTLCKDGEKIGLVAKGCDCRGILRLVQDNLLKRENVFILGIPCRGMKSAAPLLRGEKTGELPLLEKCSACTHPNPVIHDYLLGELVEVPAVDRFKRVEELEQLDTDARYAFWSGEFGKCIRCYACRNICPACNCRNCYLEQHRVPWHSKAVSTAENANYLFTRAMHVAGRCTGCGECQRACPAQLPLMALQQKIIKDLESLFGDSGDEVNIAEKQPLCCYHADDPDNFASR